MKKTLVLYYSKTGNNKYLAERFAKSMGAGIESIEPKLSSQFWLIITTLIKLGSGIRPLKNKPGDYEQIIICGPIWMGQLVSPLRSFIRRHRKSINALYFATCCGGSDSDKDGNYGYVKVFKQVKKLMGREDVYCEAFPIPIVVPKDKINDSNTIMNTRLSDENFKGEILIRFENFIEKMTA